MECLVRRDDNTVAYIHKMHNYNPKLGTPIPRPKYNKKIESKKDNNQEMGMIEILKFFINMII